MAPLPLSLLPVQVLISYLPTRESRMSWTMEVVSPRSLFLPAEQDVFPQTLPYEQRWIVFSNSQGPSASAITRLSPRRVLWSRQDLAWTLS
jgi:hypothetical protein